MEILFGLLLGGLFLGGNSTYIIPIKEEEPKAPRKMTKSELKELEERRKIPVKVCLYHDNYL